MRKGEGELGFGGTVEEEGIKIWLMVEHLCGEISHSIYRIEPPTDAADYEEKQIDSDGLMIDLVSPLITIGNEFELLEHCAMVKVGSLMYFFGGVSIGRVLSNDQVKLCVRILDIEHPELGLYSAPSLNAPKERPCGFSARGMVYALGSRLDVCNSKFFLDDGSVATGIFERYDPKAHKWQVLPDPPLPFGKTPRFDEITWCDSATVIADRYVFVGNPVPELYVIFDLDVGKWGTPFPESFISSHFPYGSLCVDNSLYCLTGFGTYKYGTQEEAKSNWLDEDEQEYEEDYRLQIIKRGPLYVEDPNRLLESHCLRPENKQLMTRLEPPDLLDECNSYEWRELLHLGGPFFCNILTSELGETFCRGVWIDVFEEVKIPASKSTHFRTLASFSYKIRTPFHNSGFYVRCCAFGSVPDSWVKEPLKKKQVAVEKKTFKAEQIPHDHASGSKGLGDCIQDKIVAAGDEEIIRLRAELEKLKADLAMKDELLKTYKSVYSAP
ncbi:uncharacterized protein LOC108227836 isoform X3 [Daucus carota subsp. sativus]|uniref:uncharacterized protein LOC108227836 isoform X3 n=1 Tax=Daucus carota subsp. sativus TaxID=79200 RepID=UPI0007EF0454|nr:PREDICTED: uncharacterized protein LOC108227836 [Daucus carota subsp. sativus]